MAANVTKNISNSFLFSLYFSPKFSSTKRQFAIFALLAESFLGEILNLIRQGNLIKAGPAFSRQLYVISRDLFQPELLYDSFMEEKGKVS